MYQSLCLNYDAIGKKMAFGNYKISINLVYHKKQTNLLAPFAHFNKFFMCQSGSFYDWMPWLSRLRNQTLAELFSQFVGSSPVAAKILYLLLFREFQIVAY